MTESNGAVVICLKGAKSLMALGEVYAARTNRGSNMSAHVLLNLLNKLRKRDKMRGTNDRFWSTNDRFYLSYDIKTILKIDSGARMIDSIYHMTLKLF